MSNENNVIKSYKGFDKNLQCRGFQYEVGKEYEQDGKIRVCNNGFHGCVNPLDVLGYYGDNINNRFCEIEQSGEIDEGNDKTASSKIMIKAEIGWAGLFKAGVEYLKEITNPKNIKSNVDGLSDNGGDGAQIGSSGNGAKIGSSGDGAQIGSSGDGAKIGSSGNYAKITSTGEDSVICCTGHDSVVSAKQGSWITLSEWEWNEEKKRSVPKCVKTEYVDGERIKADTPYKLVNGEFVEVK